MKIIACVPLASTWNLGCEKSLTRGDTERVQSRTLTKRPKKVVNPLLKINAPSDYSSYNRDYFRTHPLLAFLNFFAPRHMGPLSRGPSLKGQSTWVTDLYRNLNFPQINNQIKIEIKWKNNRNILKAQFKKYSKL
jgi:hypothetical protein